MGWMTMRLVPSVCMLALAVSACAETGGPRSSATEVRSSGIDGRQFAALETADCGQIRATMREAVSARSDATRDERAGEGDADGHGVAFSVVTAFVPIPGLGLLRRAATAAAEATEPEETAEAVESAALYRAAQTSYREKGCGAEQAPDVS